MPETDLTAVEALQTLQREADDFSILNVLMSANSSDHPSGYEARRFKTNEALREKLWPIVHANVSSTEDADLKPYSIGYRPSSHELMYLKASEEEELEQFRSHMTSLTDIPDFEENTSITKDLYFYGFRASSEAGQPAAIFCRKPHSTNDISVNAAQKKGFRAILGSGNRYEPFEKNVFRFDGRVDFFIWKGYFFVSNLTHFHYVIGKFEEIRDQVNSHVDDLKGKLPNGLSIGNEQELREACTNDARMARKLVQVVNRPYWDNGEVTLDKIENVIDRFNLREEERIDFDGSVLHFNSSPKQRWTLLKLLDDDYLGSEMTGLNYETNSKLTVGE